jgi:hypothetical protein
MDKDDKVRTSALNCLQQYKEELRSDKCKAQIHRMSMRASRDIRFDEVLASACTEDRNKYCTDIQPGSARVIRCLQVRRALPRRLGCWRCWAQRAGQRHAQVSSTALAGRRLTRPARLAPRRSTATACSRSAPPPCLTTRCAWRRTSTSSTP